MTEDEAKDWLDTWVRETCDGHEHVIYTAQAGMVLAASDNDTAYTDECGESPKDSSVAACWALIADVWDHLSARSDEWKHDDEPATEPE